ncbi:MAG: adenylate kinase [Clostridia bacterium]|nr:adenylate kinase [Clostridia bacterium]
MIVLIAGTTHTGKTVLAQRLMEKYNMPYFSIDHLKMGLIRSGQTSLTVNNDAELTPYLWSIVKEIIKTAIENKQNLIVEGCYIPFDWQKDFEKNDLQEIRYRCLIMSAEYIENHFDEIIQYKNIIEKRLYDTIDKSELIQDNTRNLQLCKKYNLPYILIDKVYDTNIEL